MPISIAWGTKIISVPRTYLTPLGGVFYELDVDQFRLDLKTLEASDKGMPFLDTHRHNTEVVLSGDIYARFIEIINGYTVTFEDGQYVTRCVGANHNIADIKNANQVSLIIGNSAGLIRATTDEIASSILDAARVDYDDAGSIGEAVNQIIVIDGKVDAQDIQLTSIENSLSIVETQTLPVFRTHQGWVDNIDGNKMILDAAVHRNGQVYKPSVGSTLDLELYENGSLAHTASGITMDSEGFFQIDIVAGDFNPAAGNNFISVTTVTEGVGGAQYKSATVVSRAAFTETG